MPEGKKLTMLLSREQADLIEREVNEIAERWDPEWEVFHKYQYEGRWCVQIHVKYTSFWVGSMSAWRKIKFKYAELTMIAQEAKALGFEVWPNVNAAGVMYIQVSGPRGSGIGFERVGGLPAWNKLMAPREDQPEPEKAAESEQPS